MVRKWSVAQLACYGLYSSRRTTWAGPACIMQTSFIYRNCEGAELVSSLVEDFNKNLTTGLHILLKTTIPEEPLCFYNCDTVLQNDLGPETAANSS